MKFSGLIQEFMARFSGGENNFDKTKSCVDEVRRGPIKHSSIFRALFALQATCISTMLFGQVQSASEKIASAYLSFSPTEDDIKNYDKYFYFTRVGVELGSGLID